MEIEVFKEERKKQKENNEILVKARSIVKKIAESEICVS